jgi:hypothetical protein
MKLKIPIYEAPILLLHETCEVGANFTFFKLSCWSWRCLAEHFWSWTEFDKVKQSQTSLHILEEMRNYVMSSYIILNSFESFKTFLFLSSLLLMHKGWPDTRIVAC